MERRRVVSADPPNYESRLDLVAGWITPRDLHFVRSQHVAPNIDPRTYRLSIEGDAVGNPIQLSLADLKALPSRSQVNWLECAGNSRVQYERVLGKAVDPAQLPWGQGAVSNSEWTGVSLSTVLDLADIKPSAVDVMPEGLDDGKIARPMPIDIARRPETILAYAMNGDPLPPDNGFPVRMVVPGWIGTNSIKWVGRVVVSSEPIKVKWNTTSYAMHGPDYPDDPALTFQPVKSVLSLPWEADLSAGPQTVRGFAWSPYGRVARVEYSFDGGAHWEQANLLAPNEPLAWVRWEFNWKAAPGSYEITTRATDEQGNTQPDSVQWNSLGYLYSACVAHPVTVSG
ncbi:MAG: sulfite oxidase [Chloroflexi bacterium]|nr:sulfite oxidase [Chloroflexota bacterium]